MILVTDSGSTKTEWRILNEGTSLKSFQSTGINPFFLASEDIFRLLKKEVKELSKYSFQKVFFYGTGCNSEARHKTIRDVLERFLTADEIFTASDLLGAARSLCQNEAGIACIIGTGSNSCYYNGKFIVSNVAPLGYILGDEGGGAVLGRKLISAILKKQVPKSVIDLFFEKNEITAAEILENVYMKPFPNRFLGQYTRFIHENSHIPELREIITTSFEEFIRWNILQYPEAGTLPVNFTGSIAFHFRSFLEDALTANNLKTGNITLSPMENLVKFHLSNL